MRASEILRKLADIIDSKETGGQGMEIVRPVGGDVSAPQPTDTAGIEGTAQVNTKSMVGPLQQKLELLKKSAGINSAYSSGELSTHASSDECDICPECQCAPCGCEGPDELAIMKQNAGIPVAIQIDAEDNDIEG
jgi:hypothetical protein